MLHYKKQADIFKRQCLLFLNDSNSLKKNSNIKGGRLDFTSRVIGVCENEKNLNVSKFFFLM